MEFAFESKELRAICEDEEQAAAALGPGAATHLQNRLADLAAATTVADVVAGTPRLMNAGEASEQIVLDLQEGWELAIRPNHPKVPMQASGTVDWSRVTRIRIVRLGRHNA